MCSEMTGNEEVTEEHYLVLAASGGELLEVRMCSEMTGNEEVTEEHYLILAASGGELLEVRLLWKW